jgi:hypothetical protein
MSHDGSALITEACSPGFGKTAEYPAFLEIPRMGRQGSPLPVSKLIKILWLVIKSLQILLLTVVLCD